MPQTAKSLSQQAALLPPVERMELVERILDTLDASDQNLDEQWAREAEDRLIAYRRGEIKALPLGEVLGRYMTKSSD